MSLTSQVLLYNALVAAAQAHTPPVPGARVVQGAAPSGTAAPYITYTFAGGSGPMSQVYGRSWMEGDVYLVTCWATSPDAAQALLDTITTALDTSPSGLVQINIENRIPSPSPTPNQTRYAAGRYLRVIYPEQGA